MIARLKPYDPAPTEGPPPCLQSALAALGQRFGAAVTIDPDPVAVAAALEALARAADGPAPPEDRPELVVTETEQYVLSMMTAAPMKTADVRRATGYGHGYVEKLLGAMFRKGAVVKARAGWLPSPVRQDLASGRGVV